MSGQVGIITNDRSQVFQKTIIDGVQSYLEPQDYEIVVTALNKGDFNHEVVRDLTAVLVIANALPADDLKLLYNTGKPITLVSHIVDDIAIPAVVQNNVDGIRKLIDYLVVRCGRQNIAFICGDMNQHDGIEREAIFKREMVLHDLTVLDSHLLRGDFDPVIAAESMQAFLDAGYDCDAVIVADYVMGVAALEVLQAAGIKVPEDMCIVGFGDGEEAEAAGLSTVGADVFEMGRRAARQLLAQIDGQRFTGITWMGTEMIPRATCMPKEAEA